MAALSQGDRTALGGQLQSDVSLARENFGNIVKADIQAAVNAVDDWVVANAAAFNAAIPAAARAALTAPQKARLLAIVVTRRFQTGA
jgi:hypothetical protein